MKIRTLIVDDEVWARRRILTLLKDEPDVEVVGESSSGADALMKIEELSPALVFLDIQMRGLNGFEVVDAIPADRMPLFIFATAYDEYALRAFDANALDYLLKPFDEGRFREALKRARKELELTRESFRKGVRSLLESLRSRQGYVNRLAIKSRGKVIFIKPAEIHWVAASGNYVTLHIEQDSHFVRTTINDFLSRLDPERFVRIHRSTVVNLNRVQELLPWSRGTQFLKLKDGTKLPIGRAFRLRLSHLLASAMH